MALNTSLQYAGDARVPFAFGGSGSARVIVPIQFTAAEAETDTVTHTIFKPLKACVVRDFSTWADDLDAGANFEFDIGAAGDDFASGTPDVDEFIDGATVAQAGGSSATQTTEAAAGVALTANDYITITIVDAADSAEGSAGTIWVAFDVDVIDE
jgi:hypothetical protein